MVRYVKKIVIALACLSPLGPTPYTPRPDGILPTVVTVDPQVASPGETVVCTVEMDGTSSTPVSLVIDPDGSGQFSAFPSTVIVPPNTDHVEFEVTLSLTAEAAGLEASANGGSAHASVTIIQ